MKHPRLWSAVLPALLLAAAARADAPPSTATGLTGAWRAQMHFNGGAFAAVKDLEFMYVYNAGGTLTESSNYDASPPVPPAYGIWRQSGPGTFQSKYVFYVTKAPKSFKEITQGGGWSPDGSGIFTEEITLSADGNSYTAKVSYAAFDANGKPVPGGGEGTATGRRITF